MCCDARRLYCVRLLPMPPAHWYSLHRWSFTYPSAGALASSLHSLGYANPQTDCTENIRSCRSAYMLSLVRCCDEAHPTQHDIYNGTRALQHLSIQLTPLRIGYTSLLIHILHPLPTYRGLHRSLTFDNLCCDSCLV